MTTKEPSRAEPSGGQCFAVSFATNYLQLFLGILFSFFSLVASWSRLRFGPQAGQAIESCILPASHLAIVPHSFGPLAHCHPTPYSRWLILSVWLGFPFVCRYFIFIWKNQFMGSFAINDFSFICLPRRSSSLSLSLVVGRCSWSLRVVLLLLYGRISL